MRPRAYTRVVIKKYQCLLQGYMSVYSVTNAVSPLATVEFSPVSEGNFAFFTVKNPVDVEQVKLWLESKEMGQKIIGEVPMDGRVVLTTHGGKTADGLIKT